MYLIDYIQQYNNSRFQNKKPILIALYWQKYSASGNMLKLDGVSQLCNADP